MMADSGSEVRISRIELAATPDFDLGDLRVKPARRQLCIGAGNCREIEPRVMQVLVALASVQPEVMSRDQLIESCWDGRIVGDDSINRCIVALRRIAKKIDPPAFAIETVARVGYCLVADGATPKPAAEPVPVAKSVAVLPFANLTGDPAKDYLADGMAEELIATLSRTTDLRVPARTSTFSYKGRNIDVRGIARELG